MRFRAGDWLRLQGTAVRIARVVKIEDGVPFLQTILYRSEEANYFTVANNWSVGPVDLTVYQARGVHILSFEEKMDFIALHPELGRHVNPLVIFTEYATEGQ